MRVLFVCLGNICRSPTAEGVMRKLVSEAGLDSEIEIDSAGTGNWHVGERPDRRSAEHAAARGYHLDSIARQVRESDFSEFDLIVAMDRANFTNLEYLALPSGGAAVRLLREFGEDEDDLEVPDPYHGGERGFEEVLDIVERCCAGLLEEIRAGTATAPR